MRLPPPVCKAFALGARVTHVPPVALVRDLRALLLSHLPHAEAEATAGVYHHRHYVFLNGEILGTVPDPEPFVRELRRCDEILYQADIHHAVSVCASPMNHVYVHTDDVRRPAPMPARGGVWWVTVQSV